MMGVTGDVESIEVGGWEPEIFMLQELLRYYHDVPTVEDIDAYLKKIEENKGISYPDETKIKMRSHILKLMKRIREQPK